MNYKFNEHKSIHANNVLAEKIMNVQIIKFDSLKNVLLLII